MILPALSTVAVATYVAGRFHQRIAWDRSQSALYWRGYRQAEASLLAYASRQVGPPSQRPARGVAGVETLGRHRADGVVQ